MTTGIQENVSEAVRDRLRRRHDDAYAAWSRQDAVEQAIRAGQDIGPGDEADRASSYADLGEQAAFTRALRTNLDDLFIALERVENGSYGRCDRCAAAIPAERLELFPAAAYCVTCKQRLERR